MQQTHPQLQTKVLAPILFCSVYYPGASYKFGGLGRGSKLMAFEERYEKVKRKKEKT
jgi:hypothetical protein